MVLRPLTLSGWSPSSSPPAFDMLSRSDRLLMRPQIRGRTSRASHDGGGGLSGGRSPFSVTHAGTELVWQRAGIGAALAVAAAAAAATAQQQQQQQHDQIEFDADLLPSWVQQINEGGGLGIFDELDDTTEIDGIMLIPSMRSSTGSQRRRGLQNASSEVEGVTGADLAVLAEDDLCPICLSCLNCCLEVPGNPPDLEVVRVKRCKHIFCEPCLTRWFQVSTVCPLCKLDLSADCGDDEEDDDEDGDEDEGDDEDEDDDGYDQDGYGPYVGAQSTPAVGDDPDDPDDPDVGDEDYDMTT